MSEQVRGILGFAMRAGQVQVGANKALELIARGKAALVLVDESAAGNTRDRLERKCLEARVPLRTLAATLLGQAIGRPQTMAAALPKSSFTDRLLLTLPPPGTTNPDTDNETTAEAIN